MKIEDIVVLAKAGFTAEQIARMSQPAPAPAPAPANDVAAQIAALTAAIHANGIINSTQPKQETADDILANILDPGRNKEGAK